MSKTSVMPMTNPWPQRDLTGWKIYKAPLPTHKCEGYYIGWDKDHVPYVLHQQDGQWRGVSLIYEPATDIHSPTTFVMKGGNADLITHWAHSPMGPDPNKLDQEMMFREFTDHMGLNAASVAMQALQDGHTSLMRKTADCIGIGSVIKGKDK